MILKLISASLFLNFFWAIGGCTIMPANGYVHPAPAYPVTVMRPIYPMPAPGYYWREQPGYGWGWHHPLYGWHRHW